MHGEERTNMIWFVPLVAQYVQVDDPTLLTISAEGICAAQKEDQCIGNGLDLQSGTKPRGQQLRSLTRETK